MSNMAAGFRARALLAGLLAMLPVGCSADMAPEPEPTLYTSGAFVAVEDQTGSFDLYRTLAVLGDGSTSDALFLTHYGVKPKSYAEAAELAKRRDLASSPEVTVLGKGYFDRHEWRVVWFRSLSVEEQAALR
ncbi:MAG TPA: hypothetical protein VJN18_17485 [Polyangiaceae bacterium]|nr:hypothetical protein [Polyangiaceae bacterium]